MCSLYFVPLARFLDCRFSGGTRFSRAPSGFASWASSQPWGSFTAPTTSVMPGRRFSQSPHFANLLARHGIQDVRSLAL